MKKKIYIISILLFITDLISKLLVVKYVKDITIIKDFFSLYLTYNDGVAFSLLKGKQLLVIILSFIALLYINISLIKECKSKLDIISISLINGGILGNLFDRIIYNEVIDFLSFKIFNYYFPVFNLADTFICIGVGLIIIKFIKDEVYDNRSKRK